MDNVIFFVPGTPQAKQRARIHNGRAYTPDKTTGYETEIIHAYLEKYGNFSFQDKTPLNMIIIAMFKKAKTSKLSHPTGKDWDNIGKIVGDALNKVAYDDDRNIVKGTVEKIFSDQEGVVVHIKKYVQEDAAKCSKIDIPIQIQI
jgi:Holliday junction resolvase RusA-like endonuclease